VLIDQDKCAVCRLCIDACPYKTIIEIHRNKVMKCDGCYDDVAIGLNPTCVRACPTRALSYKKSDIFVDLVRIDSEFDRFGINPSVIYLTKRNNTKISTNS
jgi:Fe-S-cluster-containing dehydrogenase component